MHPMLRGAKLQSKHDDSVCDNNTGSMCVTKTGSWHSYKMGPSALRIKSIQQQQRLKNKMFKKSFITLALAALLANAFNPALGAPLAEENVEGVESPLAERSIGILGGLGDNCFDHRANLAANVRANEHTNAANMQTPTTPLLLTPLPYYANNAYQLNAANTDNCFDHRANLAANVRANEHTNAANNANTYNTAATNTVVAKRQFFPGVVGLGQVGYGYDNLFGSGSGFVGAYSEGAGIVDPFWLI
ncbi:uncharacterized protein VTP21DRAFT_5182 [Calcarisporiella thermophila]|uniref:uncharacterized protein n=1 Tax=Calcarisporiella thermophila TaxID=911321 RepID=UPI0037439036